MTTKSMILHVGAPKTGSSSIQFFLRKNKDKLYEKGFLVPDRDLGLDGLVTGEHVWAVERISSRGDREVLKVFSNIKREIEKSKKEMNIIVSAENLCNTKMAEKFSLALQEIPGKVIIYIRRQDEFLSSAWQQWYSKIEEDFDAWLIKALSDMGNWLEIIEAWEAVVGKDNIKIKIFEKEEFVEGDLLKDFVSNIGLEKYLDYFNYEIGRVNPSYSDIITYLVAGNRRIFSSVHDNEFYKLVDKLTGDGYIEKRKVSLFTQRQRENIVEYYKDINDRICKKYFPGRESLFQPVKHARYQYLSKEEILDRQLKFITEMIFKLAQEK